MTRAWQALRVVPSIIVGLGLSLGACRTDDRAASEAKRDPPPEEKRETGGHETEHHSDHAEKKVSDLDLPVEELFTSKCEHGILAFQCAECRYESGVVQVQPKLFQRGLIHAAAVGRQRAATAIALTGEVRFDERRIVHLSPQVEGIIHSVQVTLGDEVKKGQTLLELDSMELGQAQAEYLENRGTLQLAQRTHQRQVQLRQESISSEREALEAEQSRRAADIRLRSSREKLLRLGVSPSALEALRDDSLGGARGRLALRAPIAGRVVEMHAVPGEMARSGKGLLMIGDTSSVWVWADVYEADLARVTAEQRRGALRATVSARAFPGQVFAGKVDLLGTTMEEATRTVKLRINVENPDGKLRPGMFAEVRLLLPAAAEVLAVPAAAVLQDEGRSFVFIHHHESYYVRRPVVTGERWGDSVEILKGLTGKETVVTDGCFLLKSDVLRSKMGAGCAD